MIFANRQSYVVHTAPRGPVPVKGPLLESGRFGIVFAPDLTRADGLSQVIAFQINAVHVLPIRRLAGPAPSTRAVLRRAWEVPPSTDYHTFSLPPRKPVGPWGRSELF